MEKCTKLETRVQILVQARIFFSVSWHHRNLTNDLSENQIFITNIIVLYNAGEDL